MTAAIWDTPYNIVYVVHLIAVILGAGMAFLAPVMAAQGRRQGGRDLQAAIDSSAGVVVFPALLVAGIAGGALVGLSSNVYDFGQSWLGIGGALWIGILVLAAVVYPPTWLRVITVSEDRRAMFAGLLHLGLAVMLVVMTWKFGV